MHIAYDHQVFSRQQYGGISRYFCELARNLSIISTHHIEIFAPFHFNEYLPILSNASHNGLKLQRLPIVLGPFTVMKINTVLAHIALKFRNNLDILHETYYSQSDYKPASAKRIITVYDMTHEIFSDSYLRGSEVPQLKAYAVQRADHVICISKNTQRDLIERLSVPEEKTSVTHLSYSLTASKPIRMPHLTDKPFILFVGERGGYKNFAKLLRAFGGAKMLRDNFSLLCFGGGSFSSHEKKLINDLSLSTYDIIQVSGTDRFLSEIYSNAKAFVYPSLYEGFGIPLLEAMSLGCPVACSNTSSFPEIVGDAAEFFDPDDEHEISTAIQQIVFHSDRARHLTEKGHERIKHFSWAKCAKQTLNIYENLLQR